MQLGGSNSWKFSLQGQIQEMLNDNNLGAERQRSYWKECQGYKGRNG